MKKLALTVFLCILTIFIVDFAFIRFGVIDNGEECTSVIVTGTASDGGYAVLAKNRDTGDSMNEPDYYPATGGLFACVMVNGGWMGINERGLAVMNTALVALAFGGAGLDNGLLNRWIAQHCETVDQVCYELNNTAGDIGPGKRLGGTCIGVVDRFGEGAFIEVSGVGAYARFIVNSYDSEANHPRYYPGYASGPSGRDQYALDIMNTIHAEKGAISYKDVAQRVMRFVREKEEGNASFSVGGEIPNDSTQASFVAVSGISEYDGKLSCFWGEYGNNPIVGLYVPSMAFAGAPPAETQNLYDAVSAKKSYVRNGTNYYLPDRVREVQSIAFAAEDYAFQKYDALLSSVPNGLNNSMLASLLAGFVSDSVSHEVSAYSKGLLRTADLNGDGRVDMYDALVLARHFNLRSDSQGWDTNVDLNGDGAVDVFDALIFATNYGKPAS